MFGGFMVKYEPKQVEVDGIKFNRDLKTGYYLSSRKIDGKRKRLHVYVWEKQNGPVPKGYDVHHKDLDKDNNEPLNLEIRPAGWHSSFHSKKYAEDNYEAVIEKMNTKARPAASKWHGSPEGRRWHSKHGKEVFKNMVKHKVTCIQCGKSFMTYQPTRAKFCSDACAAKYRRAAKTDDVTKICPVCGKSFRTNKYDGAKTCSRHCGGIINAYNRMRKSKIG
jgi:predicted nucleic acid-binding Zn ribbon protein